jgi:hypothetical protein
MRLPLEIKAGFFKRVSKFNVNNKVYLLFWLIQFSQRTSCILEENLAALFFNLFFPSQILTSLKASEFSGLQK